MTTVRRLRHVLRQKAELERGIRSESWRAPDAGLKNPRQK
jgi:hypothetical protein